MIKYKCDSKVLNSIIDLYCSYSFFRDGKFYTLYSTNTFLNIFLDPNIFLLKVAAGDVFLFSHQCSVPTATVIAPILTSLLIYDPSSHGERPQK